ncbi:MAG: CoA transferase [Gaiellaceae bacterium]|nr:MAG: CoA transferase [Gaiellaceae bacterium]
MSGPLEGVRVVELAQYVAGPLCGVLLADLGAEVVKVEPPGGDGYRHVQPVAPGVGRFFVPLNRGKRSVVCDLKTERGRREAGRLVRRADVVLHNFAPERAARFGLAWDDLHRDAPELVVGVVSSFGGRGPLAHVPAYDLVAQAHAGLLTAHASAGDRVPVRAGGIPIADLTAGLLLASRVLAALVRARETGAGELVEVSLLAAALAVQVQDLVWIGSEGELEGVIYADPERIAARAAAIERGVATNPYYRVYATADGYVAVACLNLAQRRAFLALFDLDDPTIDAPDLEPEDPAVARGKEQLAAEIEKRVAAVEADRWVAELRAAGVPAARVLMREGLVADEQVAASGLITTVEQPGLGPVTMLASLVSPRAGGAAPAPVLGADTEAVLGALE